MISKFVIRVNMRPIHFTYITTAIVFFMFFNPQACYETELIFKTVGKAKKLAVVVAGPQFGCKQKILARLVKNDTNTGH